VATAIAAWGRTLLRFVVLAWVSAVAFWSSPLHAQAAQMDTIKDQLVGDWTLVSVTTHVGRISLSQESLGPTTLMTKDFQPYGPSPTGKLLFGQDGRFVSTVANSDGSKPASHDPDAPAAFEASSGTYAIHPSRPKTLILEIEPSGDRKFYPQYIAIKTVTPTELEFSTMAPPGGVTHSSFVYRRTE
jgi:hypothetical protein